MRRTTDIAAAKSKETEAENKKKSARNKVLKRKRDKSSTYARKRNAALHPYSRDGERTYSNAASGSSQQG